MHTIILDLDGPILDGRARHYACYERILRKHGCSPLSPGQYWHLKREQVPVRNQLGATGAEWLYDIFMHSWLDAIEELELLALDQIQPGSIETLQRWRAEGVRILAATLRQFRDRLLQQLNGLRLARYMDEVAVCDHVLGGAGKAEAIRRLIGPRPARCLWVGDSEVDVEGARLLGCPVWVVTCGVRSRKRLQALAPDFISEDLTGIPSGLLDLPP